MNELSSHLTTALTEAIKGKPDSERLWAIRSLIADLSGKIPSTAWYIEKSLLEGANCNALQQAFERFPFHRVERQEFGTFQSWLEERFKDAVRFGLDNQFVAQHKLLPATNGLIAKVAIVPTILDDPYGGLAPKDINNPKEVEEALYEVTSVTRVLELMLGCCVGFQRWEHFIFPNELPGWVIAAISPLESAEKIGDVIQAFKPVFDLEEV